MVAELAIGHEGKVTVYRAEFTEKYRLKSCSNRPGWRLDVGKLRENRITPAADGNSYRANAILPFASLLIYLSVKSIKASVFDSGDNYNHFWGYKFDDEIDVTGTNLLDVYMSQTIDATTTIENLDGTGNLTTPQIVAFSGPGTDPTVVNSGGPKLDTDWYMKPIADSFDPLIDTSTNVRILGDVQSASVPRAEIWGTLHEYSNLATISRTFADQCYIKDPFLSTGLPVYLPIGSPITWGYTWSNQACAWKPFQEPVPPALACAVDYNNGGKGTFDPKNIDGLAALND